MVGPVLTVDGADVGTAGAGVHGDRLMAWIRERAAGLPIECRRYRSQRAIDRSSGRAPWQFVAPPGYGGQPARP